MDGKFMEFYAEVRHVGSSSGFRPPGPSTDPVPSHVLALEDATMQDYNSGEDSDYEEDFSCHSTEEDEEAVVGHARRHVLILVPGRPVVAVRAPQPHPDHPLP
ncbi:hypothetical protein PIB30_072866 [Stylosanthes scabra]|uniref:Uncharacterized protein n=1 Tax=Stylosanthes scabra TaxID=79078 RepID=A0ABU6QNS6_9FABA|nr:hypothetical protein [Stylosanthes scabra]